MRVSLLWWLSMGLLWLSMGLPIQIRAQAWQLVDAGVGVARRPRMRK